MLEATPSPTPTLSPTRRQLVAVLALMTITVLAATAPLAALSPVNKSLFGGVAIKGYDPVAYFLASKPIEGSKEITFEWQGATWRFASLENRDAFATQPEKYAPQFGGYCAYAVGKGYTAKIDPQAWSVVEGKLYLNYSPAVQREWEKDRAALITSGEVNWPKLLAKE